MWATVREALRGTEAELTAVPIRRAVALLAIPTVLEMSLESLFAVVDIFFVAKLGPDAVATVGMTESMLALIYALAMGLGAGATAIVARRTGERDPRGAARAAGQVVLVALVAALLVGGIGGALARPLLAVMGATESVVVTGTSYTRTMLAGSVTIFLLFVVNAIFRAAGDAVVAMRALWLANGLNMVLAPFFIFGIGPFPRCGVLGAAIATTASRAVGVAYQALMLSRGRQRLPFRLSDLLPVKKDLVEIARISAAASVQVLVETASWLGLVRILSVYGSLVLAGYTIAMRVAIFAMLPSWGLANAAATLVGQNLGAREPDRAASSVKTIAFYNVVYLGMLSLVFVVAPRPIVGLFTDDTEIAASALRTTAIGFTAFAYGMVMIQAFNGAGDTLTPVGINLACFWLFKIPLAYVLARHAGLGPRGVFLAITLAYTLQTGVASVLFRRGSWRRAPGM